MKLLTHSRRLFSSSSKIAGVPSIKDFLNKESTDIQPEEDLSQLPGYLHILPQSNQGKTYFVETHGCQMNVADSEIVETVLDSAGFTQSEDAESADVLLLNTCAIREGAETKIWNKLRSKYHGYKTRKPEKIIGLLGCMAERLKEKVLEHGVVDMVAGPDAYRDIPRLIKIVENSSEDE